MPIGRWVLRTACEQAAHWRTGRELGISVNISARQLHDVHLPEHSRVRWSAAGSRRPP